MSNKIKLFSVIIPVYNEIGNIAQFHQHLLKTLTSYKKRFEIIYIDDNSTDGTYEWLQSISLAPTIKVILKNGIKGKAYSLIQGFDVAKGDAFVMIDGDLQYPPEKIPEMIDALQISDIVVAERKKYKDSTLRKFLSKGFKTVFGKMMFGLNTDIQSGLKAFTKEVYQTIQFQPVSPWTFDLEFLYRSQQAGFSIKNVSIIFAPRLSGESKVNALNQSWEIGTNALSIKMKRKLYLPIKAVKGSMRGAGIGYKKKKYITHTTLPASLSAIETFSLSQKIFFLGFPVLLILALFMFPLPAARTIVGVLSMLYFIDALFNVFVVTRSLQKDHDIKVSDDELSLLDESKLPLYSILCPLYKEAHVVPQFLEGIAKLDYPKDKLDVMFLLEEDDLETIAAFGQMTLPYYARTVIVPDSQPKTKPKACNYGLSYAKGKYLVIFDAEDLPDPLQLKKAVIGFKKVPADIKCLQAKLSYYNSRQNLLTRFFTAEYALWFDVTLPGLQSLNSALPLGGTSNHFETANLRELEGWDPFNVTEDADLGVRLFKHGYRTAIIDSTTYEEATSVTKNWLRQRSRWLKGYMQTYLVQMRNINSFVKNKGVWHTIIFQLTVGGKILFVLLNPFMWIITILYFSAYSIFGPVMQEIYQPPLSYFAVFSWIFGNFMFLYCYMIAVGKRGQWDLAKYVLLIPFYWVLMSTAAMVGLYQLILKPHYWEKTIHGFHLTKKNLPVPAVKPVGQPIAQPVYVAAATPVNKIKDTPFVLTMPSQINVSTFILRWLPLFAILNTDLVLARFFLPYEDAQLYIVLSLFGKAVFILSQFLSNVLTAATSKKRVSKGYLYRLLFFTFLFNWIGFVVFGLEGSYTIPALLGNTYTGIIPYMGYYLFGLTCLGLTNRLTTFNLYKKKYSYTMLSVAIILLQVPFIILHHETVYNFVRIFAYFGSINLFVLVVLQMSVVKNLIMENNFISIFKLFDKQASKKAWNQNNMRILIFNWRDTKHIYAGGAEVYIHELAQRWVKNGNKVTLFSGNDNNNSDYEIVDGVEIFRRGGTYTIYIFAFLYYLLKFRGKYDVIIDCENGIPFFTPLYAKEQVILLVHHVHQEIFRNFLRFPLSIIAELLEGKMMPLVYQNKNVVTVSASSQKDIFKLGFTNAGNIEIIPNGVSSGLFVDYPKTDNPSFVYLGRLKEYKNIDVAIKAFAKVLRIHKKATLAIVGSGESFPVLADLVTDLNIHHAIKFYGRVSEAEKAKLLAKSWAAIQPSQIEGWGITVIEANAAGTPVIASNVNGLQDSVVDGQTGLLVQAGNVTQFANAMMKIAEDDDVRISLSQEAQLWAKKFDWDSSATAFYGLIGKNLGQGAIQPSYTEVAFTSSEK
ncbi:MAG: glycosyltransferase [Candidatus Levyibacteriota bacterium]